MQATHYATGKHHPQIPRSDQSTRHLFITLQSFIEGGQHIIKSMNHQINLNPSTSYTHLLPQAVRSSVPIRSAHTGSTHRQFTILAMDGTDNPSLAVLKPPKLQAKEYINKSPHYQINKSTIESGSSVSMMAIALHYSFGLDIQEF